MLIGKFVVIWYNIMMSEPIVCQLCKWRNRQTNKENLEDEFYGDFYTSHFLFFLLLVYYHSEGSKAHLKVFWGEGGVGTYWLKTPFRQLRTAYVSFLLDVSFSFGVFWVWHFKKWVNPIQVAVAHSHVYNITVNRWANRNRSTELIYFCFVCLWFICVEHLYN